ncbi:fas apoptotic inhibitory molecule 3 isoform X2 [Talpa occidentalis]|uniref:fas apoptotic inhibitory molecule 3 isoform X2 n=1 Tax=Talpa occidentalis TaxID=50954 RepID=UPI0023F74884|nr:fas apoptotic inhibitory molecule 3 isoform X2 [Talpa occidentalis]
MKLWLWLLYFLPVSGALRFLPEMKLEGILGGSITIECPLPKTYMRIYLCRKMTDSRICATVISNQNFVKKEYKRRVSLKYCPNKNVYLVEVTNLAKSDSGIYACGAGQKTDRGRTQQVILNVRSGLARRVSRQAVRTRAPAASRRPRPHAPRASPRPRAQNIYSACPRSARGADSAVTPEVPLPGPGDLAPPTPPQVSVTSWFHAPSLKTSNEYMSIHHQRAGKVGDTDPDDYVNFPC